MFYIFVSGYSSRTIQDVKFKFSAFLSLVEAKKYVKFQSARSQVLELFPLPLTHSRVWDPDSTGE